MQHGELSTTIEVIEALGGISAVAELTNREYNAAHNWKSFQTFPPDTFLVMTTALERIGHRAPASLWRQVAPKVEA